MSRKLTYILCTLIACLAAGTAFSQPLNDNCVNAIDIPISNGGWGYGSFVSDTVDLTGATLEGGEFVHPAQVAQDKSVWFKFYRHAFIE